jgi:hypothetical protein
MHWRRRPPTLAVFESDLNSRSSPRIPNLNRYHRSCRCVDLEVTLLDLPAGRFLACVYARGDAPNQNAIIEVQVADRTIGKKATANDGRWGFRESPFVDGVHYVTFDFDVEFGNDVRFISHRDGSDYSMFNAIQIVPIESSPSDRVGEHQKRAARENRSWASPTSVWQNGTRMGHSRPVYEMVAL